MKVQVNVCRSNGQPKKARERVEVTVVKRSAVSRRVSNVSAVGRRPVPTERYPFSAPVNAPTSLRLKYTPIDQGTEYSSPIVEQVSPIVEQVSPIVEQVSPIVEQVSPTVEQVSPTIEQVSPTIEQVRPTGITDVFDEFFSEVTSSTERSSQIAGIEPELSDTIGELFDMIEAEEEKVRLLTQAIDAEDAVHPEVGECFEAAAEVATAGLLPETGDMPAAAQVDEETCEVVLSDDTSIDDTSVEYAATDITSSADTIAEEDDIQSGVSVRFVDRGENGQLLEVDRSVATGREVRTYDGDRLTRIFGVIRKNNDGKQRTAMVLPEDEDTENSGSEDK